MMINHNTVKERVFFAWQRLNDWLCLNSEDALDEEIEDYDHDHDDEKMAG